MTTINKPIPNDGLHTLGDDALLYLVKTYRLFIDADATPEYVEGIELRIQDIFKVLGYRAAVEYLNKHGK